MAEIGQQQLEEIKGELYLALETINPIKPRKVKKGAVQTIVGLF